MTAPGMRAPYGEPSKTWTSARLYMLVSVVFLIPTGIVGLITNQNFALGDGATRPKTADMVFGVLETNGWHSTAAVVNGLAALALLLFASDDVVRRGALFIGAALAGLTVALMIPRSIDLLDNVLASNAADNLTHATQAIGGIATGLLSGRSAPAPDRAHATATT